ncbi:MAG: methionine adenosyltransferase [Candidatus Bathyarchaeia archaeon]
MKRVLVEKLTSKPMELQNIEIVERKGLGHPDYIIDSAAENVSRQLCKFYNDNFGFILHHNVDKGLLVGGRSSPVFGGGKVEEPISITIAGRAITQAKKGNETVNVPLETIVPNAIGDFLKSSFRYLDPERHITMDYKIRPGSVDLVKIFNQGKGVPLANDTSFGVGYAPLSETEKIAQGTEQYLNSKNLKAAMPEVGEDVKVMALRRKNKITLTVAAAMISGLIPDKDHYLSVKEELKKRIEDYAARVTKREVDVRINTGDNPRAGVFYITVTGTSAERGDDGNTGRGNRINGLITPCRQMSLEATAGKNPVNHVGKTYNVLAKLIAQRIHEQVKGVNEAYVKILSQIGRPINEPQVIHVQVALDKQHSLGNISADVQSIAEEEMANISAVTDLILRGKVDLF